MKDNYKNEGQIFNIQHYCIHDGPGIRTNIFLKGCPLNCLWCQNPESQNRKRQLFYIKENCIGCGDCVKHCASDAIRIIDGKARTIHDKCISCGTCTDICQSDARSIVGEAVSASLVFEEILKDRIFYDGSGGGVTVTGGEPLAQLEFTDSILEFCNLMGIHTAIETCGYAKWENIKYVISKADLILYDIKHMDSDSHRLLTGVPNGTIHENAIRIYHELKKPIIIRTPIMPGYNDSEENLNALGNFIANGLGKDVSVHLLPYHSMGLSKSERLERENLFTCVTPDYDHMQKLKEILESYGLMVQIGG